VVHRDIKPANIRITSDDRAVLVDFGLVKLYDPGLRTTIGARAITPGYAPPEQYGRGGSTDVRSDIYGLGATFYNALTGKEPLESVQRMSGDQMLPVHQVNPAVQPHVGGAIERAMALNPDNRFQTAEAFKAALAEPAPTMVVEPIRAPQASAGVAPRVAPDRSYQRAPARTPSQPAPKKKTGRVIIGVLAVVFVLCLGTVGVFAWLMAESEEQANLESTDRAISVNQTATAFKNTLATKTALVDERATVTAEALHAAETASAQAATATAEAAAAQTAQALQAPLEAAKGWGVIAEDYFQDNANEWATGEREGTYAKITWTLADGVYRWDTLAYDGFVWWVYPEISPVSDFYLAADMTFVEGPPVAEMGLMFWHTEDNTYYVFEIDNQDDFAVFYYDSSEWTTIYEWTESDAIIPGGMNRLAVVAEGDHLLFYINDQHVAEVFNAAATTGNVGLIVGLDEADQTGIWEFYNFELRAP
jgi:hypothetical protein